MRFGLLLPFALLACGEKKAPESAAPPVGWHQEEGWLNACYFPPNFEALGSLDRRQARADVLDEMMSQWNGDRNDGIYVEPVVVQNVESSLLSTPAKIEDVVKENLVQCRAAMTGAGTSGWKQWLTGLPAELTADQCFSSLSNTMYSYLELSLDWQFTQKICEGNVVRITASSMDYYKVREDGPWINAAGDSSKPGAEADYPCSMDGCYEGQLIMKFVGRSGREVIFPVGLDYTFEAPEHGEISLMVNDNDHSDDVFKVEGGVRHHTQLTYSPVN